LQIMKEIAEFLKNRDDFANKLYEMLKNQQINE